MIYNVLIDTLAAFCDQRKRVYAPLQEIADELGWSRPKVQRGVATLQALGHVIRHHRYLELVINFDQQADQNGSDAAPLADQKCSVIENDRGDSLHVPESEQTVRQTPPVGPPCDPPPPSRRAVICRLPDDDLLPVEWTDAAKVARPDLAAHMPKVVQAFLDYHRDKQTRIMDLKSLFDGWVRTERLAKYQNQGITSYGRKTGRPVHTSGADLARAGNASDYLRSVAFGLQPSTA